MAFDWNDEAWLDWARAQLASMKPRDSRRMQLAIWILKRQRLKQLEAEWPDTPRFLCRQVVLNQSMRHLLNMCRQTRLQRSSGSRTATRSIGATASSSSTCWAST
jgi:hypothetical protein